MWDANQTFGGDAMGPGGFMPGDGDKTSEKSKRQRANNIVPVWISDILESKDEAFRVEDRDVGMVVLVGQVRLLKLQ